jgi:hypothetical protein
VILLLVSTALIAGTTHQARPQTRAPHCRRSPQIQTHRRHRPCPQEVDGAPASHLEPRHLMVYTAKELGPPHWRVCFVYTREMATLMAEAGGAEQKGALRDEESEQRHACTVGGSCETQLGLYWTPTRTPKHVRTLHLRCGAQANVEKLCTRLLTRATLHHAATSGQGALGHQSGGGFPAPTTSTFMPPPKNHL